MIFLLLNVSISTIIRDKPDPGNSFYLYREIKLDDKIIIGSVNSISISKDGSVIAVVDGMGNSVYLFNGNGDFIKKLNSEECSPGSKMQPKMVIFNSSDELYITSSTSQIFRFTKYGKCLGPSSVYLSDIRGIGFTKNNSMVLYCCPNNQVKLVVVDNKDKISKQFGEFPDEFKNILYRHVTGGVIVDKNDLIYNVIPVSNRIFVYSSNGKYLKNIDIKTDYYKQIERDLPRDPSLYLSELPKVFGGKTITNNIFLFNDNEIIVEYFYKRKYYLEFVFINGKHVNSTNIISDKPLLTATQDQLVYYSQADADEKGNLPNPCILIYKRKK